MASKYDLHGRSSLLAQLRASLSDIDLRLRQLESLKVSWTGALQDLVDNGIKRVDEGLVPVISDALAEIAQLEQLGNLFMATSSTSLTIGTGEKTLVIAADKRETFAATPYIAAISAAHPENGMLGSLVGYDRASGELTIDVFETSGAGAVDDWIVMTTPPPDLSHAQRTDNPHAVTAAQVGAYTTGQTDTAIAAAVNAAIDGLISGAPGALDTLNELAAALGDDENFAATVASSLALKADASTVTAALATKADAAAIAFSVYLSGSSWPETEPGLLDATWTKIAFDAKAYDTHNWFNTTTNRYTPQKAGYYRFFLKVLGSSTDTGTFRCSSAIQKNGNTFVYGDRYLTTPSILDFEPISQIIYMNGTTDYVEAHVYMDRPGAIGAEPGVINGNAARTFFCGEFVGT